MTIDERLDALEAKTQDLHRTVFVCTETGQAIPGLQINARVGIMTNYWMHQNIGAGAAFSVGTAIDRFAVYAELDTGPDGFAVCADAPSTAIYAAVVVPHRPGERQPNIAIEAHAANAVAGNLPLYGSYQYAPQSPLVPTEGLRLVELTADGTPVRQLSLSGNGITLKDGAQSIVSWVIKKVGGARRTLWP